MVMSIDIYYIDLNSNSYQLTTSVRKFLSKPEPEGLSAVPWKTIVDQFPYGQAVLNAYKFNAREISFCLWVEASSRENTWAKANDITRYFADDVAADENGILRFVTSSGTREIDVVPKPLEITEVWDNALLVKLGFLGLKAFWRAQSQSSANGNFNGATPVNISCNNAGDWPSFPVITITGIVDTPVLTNSDGDSLTINAATVNADDVLTIYTEYDQVRIDYDEHGAGSPVNWTGYASVDSVFWWLPVGTHNVTISASSGTAAVTIAWYNLYSGVE